MATTIAPSQTNRFIDPAVLSKIENLGLLARTVVEGFVQGLHKSPYLGFSVDFAEYRRYQPGDEIRRIDWNVFSRMDKLYVKLFEGDTNTHVNLLLDVSGSMRYGSRAVLKVDYACFLAASLAYFAYGQRDGVGLLSFDTDIVKHIPAGRRSGQLLSILAELDRATTSNETEFQKPLDYMAEFLKRRGIIVLISDLYGDVSKIMTGIKHLRSKGNDVIVFHVLDEFELNFPFDQMTEFEDLETTKRLNVIPQHLRQDYLQLIRGHIEELDRELSRLGVDYALMDTSKPLDAGLFAYLARRAKTKI